MIPQGRNFFKMSGSGNDFIMVDARTGRGELGDPARIQALCARGTGVGADGIVFLEPSEKAAVRLVYLNADGSPADFCGNATLCTTRLAVELGFPGAEPGHDFAIETESGVVTARLGEARPEIDLPAVTDIRPDAGGGITPQAGESRIGYALAGVPHLVVLCGDVATVDVTGRGRPLRQHRSLPQGANVNFVAGSMAAGWRVRTYERGVEGETLACGSGAVATAILLTAWGLASGPVQLETRSGKQVQVSLNRAGASWRPSLAGEGRIVYQATLGES